MNPALAASRRAAGFDRAGESEDYHEASCHFTPAYLPARSVSDFTLRGPDPPSSSKRYDPFDAAARRQGLAARLRDAERRADSDLPAAGRQLGGPETYGRLRRG